MAGPPIGRITAGLKGAAITRARANLRWQKARDMSDAGATRAEAEEATGMSPKGFGNMIRRHAGTESWPIKENCHDR